MEPDDAHNTDPTRERLLDEAERLFAQKGYNAVTVREITAAAGSNLAAVNYHFGNKENLYVEVFRSRWMARARKIQQSLVALEKEPRLTPEQVVRTLADAFLGTAMTNDERLRHAQLIAREMGPDSDSRVFRLLTEEALMPFMDLVIRLWQRCLPQPQDPEHLKLLALSIWSQVLYFNFARPVVSMVSGREYDQRFVDQLVEHITHFSLHGVNGSNAQ